MTREMIFENDNIDCEFYGLYRLAENNGTLIIEAKELGNMDVLVHEERSEYNIFEMIAELYKNGYKLVYVA